MVQLEQESLTAFLEALKKLDAGFAGLPGFTPHPGDQNKLLDVLTATAERLHDNYPYFHPLYAGQMLKPPHPCPRLAYALALWINPNNHALDGGRAASAIDKESTPQTAFWFLPTTLLSHP